MSVQIYTSLKSTEVSYIPTPNLNIGEHRQFWLTHEIFGISCKVFCHTTYFDGTVMFSLSSLPTQFYITTRVQSGQTAKEERGLLHNGNRQMMVNNLQLQGNSLQLYLLLCKLTYSYVLISSKFHIGRGITYQSRRLL